MTALQYLDAWGADLLAAVAAAVALAVGTVVLRVAPTRTANRRLAAVLFGEAALLVATMWLWPFNFLAMAVLAALYLALLTLLDTPLVAWIRGRERRILTACIAAFAVVLVPMSGIRAFPPWAVPIILPVGLFLIVGPFVAASLLGLVASIDAMRRAAPGTAKRRRAKAFAWAFAVRDALLLVFAAGAVLSVAFDNWSPDHEPMQGPGLVGWVAWNWFQVAPAVSLLAYVPLLAYGILRSQILDIDLKLKRGVEGGTVLAVFALVFFLAEELGQQLLSERAGPVAGLAGAGLVAVAIVPLRRFAHRVAKRAFPDADGSADYVARRKREVYRAAVEGAFEDGAVSERERAVLDRLAAELVLPPEEMATIEHEVAHAWTRTPPSSSTSP